MATFDPINNPYVARDYEDCYLVLLRNSIARDDKENEPFHIHPGPRAVGSAPNGAFPFYQPHGRAIAAKVMDSTISQL